MKSQGHQVSSLPAKSLSKVQSLDSIPLKTASSDWIVEYLQHVVWVVQFSSLCKGQFVRFAHHIWILMLIHYHGSGTSNPSL
jgi:hypothetical protein